MVMDVKFHVLLVVVFMVQVEPDQLVPVLVAPLSSSVQPPFKVLPFDTSKEPSAPVPLSRLTASFTLLEETAVLEFVPLKSASRVCAQFPVVGDSVTSVVGDTLI